MRRKALGRSLPKRGKDKREPRSDVFRQRQSELQEPETLGPVLRLHSILGDKKWLETHLWHAKRMHMENMWGYRLVSIYRRHCFYWLKSLDRQLNQQKNPSDHPIARLFTVLSSMMHPITASLN
jgi:hypothetical protein